MKKTTGANMYNNTPKKIIKMILLHPLNSQQFLNIMSIKQGVMMMLKTIIIGRPSVSISKKVVSQQQRPCLLVYINHFEGCIASLACSP